MSDPVFPTLLAGDPWIPPPPAAAPAAGGWGIHGSMPVNSVGLGGASTGDVLEVVVLSVLVSVRFSSGVGVLRCVPVKRPSLPSSEVCGSGELSVPRLVSGRWWIRCLNNSKMEECWSFATATATVGVRRGLSGGLPAAEGLAPFQGQACLWSSGGGKSPGRSGRRRGRGS